MPSPTNRDSTDPLLNIMFRMGDARADRVIENILAKSGLELANQALGQLIRNVNKPEMNSLPELGDYLKQTSQLPAWTDWEKVIRAQDLFTSQGPNFGLVLMTQSLPMLYAGGRGGAQVLAHTGQLSGHFERRASQTLRFILDVMEPGGLELDGKGIRAIQKVRLMHAAIRHYAKNNPLWKGKADEWGCPINQEELVGTLIAFSWLALDGLKKLDLEVSEADANCYMHVWKIVGYVLGIEESLLNEFENHPEKLWEKVKARNFIFTKDGVILAKAHLEFLKKLMPGKLLDGIPIAMMNFLMGKKVARKILKLPRPGLAFLFIYFIQWLFHLECKLVLSSKTLRKITSFAGEKLMESLYQTWNDGNGAPFKIPTSMTST